MKTKIYRLIQVFTACLLFTLFCSTSCKTTKNSVKVPFRDTIIVERTVSKNIYFPADSASVKAWLACDSLNRVYISKLETSEGKTVKPEVIYRDNILTVHLPIDSQKIYLQWKEHDVVTSERAIETITITKEKKVYPAWPFAIIGVLFAVILAMVLIMVLGIKKM